MIWQLAPAGTAPRTTRGTHLGGEGVGGCRGKCKGRGGPTSHQRVWGERGGKGGTEAGVAAGVGVRRQVFLVTHMWSGVGKLGEGSAGPVGWQLQLVVGSVGAPATARSSRGSMVPMTSRPCVAAHINLSVCARDQK